MNWKSIGLNVATLGVAWLVKRYRSKVPKAVLDVLDLAGKLPPDSLPPDVLETIRALERLRLEADMAKLMEAIEKAKKGIAKGLAKNSALLASEADTQPGKKRGSI
jgi:hypothetical protein